MISQPAFNAQFLAIDFRMLDIPEFGDFMKSSAFAVYLQLRRYVWRSRTKKHMIGQVNELFESGKLVCCVDHAHIARKLKIKEVSHVSRHIKTLLNMGVLQKVITGRGNIYVLGEWKDYSKTIGREYLVEIFYLEQSFGVDNKAQIQIEPDLSPEDNTELSMNDKSELHPEPDLSKSDNAALPKKDKSVLRKNADINTESEIYNKQQPSESLFEDLKISKTDRQKLMSNYPADRIREVIEASLGVESFKTSREAWILSALKENWDVRPEKDRREDKRQQQRLREEQEQRQRAIEEEQNRARDAAILEWIKNNPLDFARIMREEQENIPEALKGSAGEAIHLKAMARARVGRILQGEDLSREVEESETEETPNSALGWQVRGVGA